LRAKFVFLGIIIGVLMSAGYVKLFSHDNAVDSMRYMSNPPDQGVDQKGYLFEPMLNNKAKASQETLEKLREMNEQIKQKLWQVEGDNIKPLENILNRIPVKKAKSLGPNEITFFVSIIGEIARLGFLCHSEDIIGMCDDRMGKLASKSKYDQSIMTYHNRIIEMQRLLRKTKNNRFLISTDTKLH